MRSNKQVHRTKGSVNDIISIDEESANEQRANRFEANYHYYWIKQ